MSKNENLPIKPFQVRFGPRDQYRYVRLIEELARVPLGMRGQAAKELMLQGLEAGGIPDILTVKKDNQDVSAAKTSKIKETRKPKRVNGLDDMINMGK